LKKRTKKLLHADRESPEECTAGNKSFLVLFSKKNILPALAFLAAVLRKNILLLRVPPALIERTKDSPRTGPQEPTAVAHPTHRADGFRPLAGTLVRGIGGV
jgi:hypothetical protein